MAKCLVMKDGEIISERTMGLIIFQTGTNSWSVIYNNKKPRAINLPDVLVSLSDLHIEDLPCSTHYPPSSSPASSAGATTSRIKNTPQTQQHVLPLLTELCELQITLATLTRKLLAVTCGRKDSTAGDISDE